jgi:hypothetical protein
MTLFSKSVAFSVSNRDPELTQATCFYYSKEHMLLFMKSFRKLVQDGNGFARSENAIPLRVKGYVFHTLVLEMCPYMMCTLMDGYGNFQFLKTLTNDGRINALVDRLELDGIPKLVLMFKTENNRDQTLAYIMRHPQAVSEKMGPNSRDAALQRIEDLKSSGPTVIKTEFNFVCEDVNWVIRKTPAVVTRLSESWRTLFLDHPNERMVIAQKRSELMFKTQQPYYADWKGELCRRMDAMNALWPRSVEIPYHAPYLETLILLSGSIYIRI